MDSATRAIKAAKKFSKQVDGLRFAEPVTHVYNPLVYAWSLHEKYLKLLNPATTRILFLGMNPGPWGMAQTGVPFGQVAAVRDWLKIVGPVRKPEIEHPKRPIEGLGCIRSEVSGERLWGLFQSRFVTAEAFFKDHFVANYCPLVFMEASGKNRTPDKLPVAERAALTGLCDAHLDELIKILQPEWLVGVVRTRRIVCDESPVTTAS